jgi:hypothetical protein
MYIQPHVNRSGRMTTQNPRHRRKVTTSGSIKLLDLTVHGAHFEPTIGILPN